MEMFKCQKEKVIPIRVIDSYTYMNTDPPIPTDVINSGLERTLDVDSSPTWEINEFFQEMTYPTLYPCDQGGELDSRRSIPTPLRDKKVKIHKRKRPTDENREKETSNVTNNKTTHAEAKEAYIEEELDKQTIKPVTLFEFMGK
ncbi:unnamed protein product, partial [Didymodactylos carnosus]